MVRRNGVPRRGDDVGALWAAEEQITRIRSGYGLRGRVDWFVFLTTRSAGARRWCDRRSCPEGVMMWVPFGQLKNKLHGYDPDKGRGAMRREAGGD